MAAAGGIMWYLQFFFYAWGAANVPQHLSYVNWMLHMSLYVFCGGSSASRSASGPAWPAGRCACCGQAFS